MNREERDILNVMHYDKQYIQNKFDVVKGILGGRMESLYPYLRDSDGNFSKQKAQALIEELIQILRYEREEKNMKLTGKEQQFYECFLFLSFRLIEVGSYEQYVERYDYKSNYKGCFQDVVRLSKMVNYYATSMEELLYQEMFYTSNGFFEIVDEMIEQLTDQNIIDYIGYQATKEQLERYDRESSNDIGIDDIDFQEAWLIEEAMASGAYDYDDSSVTMSDEEIEEEQRQLEIYCKQVEEAKNKIKKRFGNADDFCDTYLQYRNLYFSCYQPGAFEREIEDMLDGYLMLSGKSYYEDTELTNKIENVIKRLTYQMSSYIRGER